MKQIRNTLALSLILIIAISSLGLAQSDPSELLQSGIYKEEVEGELEGAIEIYEKIIAEHSQNRSVAAQAQLHIGLCYEKLGKAEAIKAYELVVEEYYGQKEQVTAALGRLAELRKEPPEGLSVVNLGGWDKPGMAFQPIEISPDGAMGVGVEFIKGQNIIVYNLNTKQVKYITNHTWDAPKGYCWTYHPVLSPDAKEIVYYSSCIYNEGPGENSLIVSTLDGRSRVLASAEKVWYIPNAWLPDGSAILTIKGSQDTAPQLGLFPKKGGDFKALVTLQKKKQDLGKTYATASVSPDGRYILFTDASPDEKDDIYIMSSDGGDPSPLLKHPAIDRFPRWSPDGKSIVFQSLRHGSWALWGLDFNNGKATGEPFLIRDGMKDAYMLNWTDNGLACWNWVTINDIFIMDIDPNTSEPMGEPTQLKYTPTGGNVYPVWSPDGKSFAFLSFNNAGSSSIVVVGNTTREFPVPKEYGRGYLRWTPDGSEIGMVGANKKNQRFLHRLSLNSGNWGSTPLSVPGWTRFEWSANGKAILFSKNGTTGNGAGIIELILESGKERYVYRPDQDTSAIVIRSLRVSRDFKQLTFLETNKDLMVVDLETGENHRVASNKGNPSWSPDGQKILTDQAYATKGSKQSLFVLPVAGGSGKVIDLSKSLPEKIEIRTPDWSPDGKKIIFTLRSQKSEVLLFQNVIPNEK